MQSKRIAIVGAGPIGLEAGLYGARLGHDVQLYERGRVGENLLRWGFVRMFSPDVMNRSPLGQRVLGAGAEPDCYMRGTEHVGRYLAPLARLPQLQGRVHESCTVRSIGRHAIGKADGLGGGRERHPFLLLIDTPRGERKVSADVVLDCSGTYGNANWLGEGNVPALGERALRDEIDYTLQDVAGARRQAFAGAHVLLVGAGYSAATALDALLSLEDTRISWIARSSRKLPFVERSDDPLPERLQLSRLGNRVACGREPRVCFQPSSQVCEIRRGNGGFRVELTGPAGNRSLEVQRILAHVGYRPDRTIYRELQVHECYATGGPMRLSAALLADSNADCLAQQSKGADLLRNPEPDFFILGAKSYGSNPSFLIRLGLEQIREVYTLVQQDPELNLYAA